MLQLLNPNWLFGISGILIPLIIHLWNVKTGKTLKIGSISLMGESSRQNSRSLKLNDLLLLALRCLIIILLSLLLAEPVWKSVKIKNWVLLEKNTFTETYNNFKKEIDSLLIAGNELHLFEPEFAKVEFDDLLQDTLLKDTLSMSSYWSLVRLMEQDIPHGSKAFIFTDNRLNRFKGSRAITTIPVVWKTYSPSDSTSKWIEQAYLSSSGDIQVTMAESNARITTRKSVAINPSTVNSDIKTSINAGKLQLQFKSQNIAVDTSTIKISINSEGFTNDATYLKAAINSIQKYSSRKIKLIPASNKPDVLFWLSTKELPSNFIKNAKPGSRVFRYAKGQSISTNSWLEISGQQAPIETSKIALYKRVSYTANKNSFSIWEDGFGWPILQVDKQDELSLYTFYSRLDPEWTDLVWSPEFVKLLMPLILPDDISNEHKNFDKRSISNLQISPSAQLTAHSPRKKAESLKREAESTPSLQYYFWFLLIIAFLTERYISTKNQAM